MTSQNATTHPYHVHFREDEFQRAAQAAKDQDLSLAQLIRKLLREHVEMRKTNELVTKSREYRRA